MIGARYARDVILGKIQLPSAEEQVSAAAVASGADGGCTRQAADIRSWRAREEAVTSAFEGIDFQVRGQTRWRKVATTRQNRRST